MDKVIPIKCQGAAAIDYEKLVESQGELKTLSKTNYERLKKEIIELGFSEPILVWKEKNKIVNGHQRLRTVKHMVEKEGWGVKPLPVSFVEAKDDKELAKKILAMASVYGTVSDQGLYEFMSEWDITLEELNENYDLPNLNLAKFGDEFFNDELKDDLDDGEDPEVLNPEEGPPEDLPTGQVRMVQIYMSVEQAKEFRKQIVDLKEFYKTENVTDTVLAAVKEAHVAHPSKGTEKAKSK